MTGYIPSFELLTLIVFLAGFLGVLAALALHDPRGFLLMLRDSESFARMAAPAAETVDKTAEATGLAIAAE